MKQTIALAGNPNCGKTTLFNRLTGLNQYVGNWPGVTVEKKSGRLKGMEGPVELIDLPGIYSLSPFSAEERVARDFILRQRPDAVINVVDATQLERSLYLTLQLLELGRPVIVALNMMDMLKNRGIILDTGELSRGLGVPVVPISASRGTGVQELLAQAKQTVRETDGLRQPTACAAMYTPAVRAVLDQLEEIVEPACRKAGIPRRWGAVKLLDGEEPSADTWKLSTDDWQRAAELTRPLVSGGIQRDMITAEQKYAFIETLCTRCVRHTKTASLSASEKIDGIVTHRLLALPIFAGLMVIMFAVTFGPPGAALSRGLDGLVRLLTNQTAAGLTRAQVSPWAVSLVCDGILTGVGAVVSFFPQILLLFLFLSLLEDSGYMARAAFIMDKALYKTGLSGRAFIPMLMGFGCSVPGILAARTLESERDRRLTILLTPFMSCCAKMPVYALFIAAFFPDHRWIVVAGLYAGGMAAAVGSAAALRQSVFRGSESSFLMELPPYRLPTWDTVWRHLYERIKDFALRAGTTLLIASVIVWFLRSFDPQLRFLSDQQMESSLLATCGRWIAPLFAPLGFGFWQAAVALLAGLTAKEAVVGTLSILYHPSSEAAMTAILQNVFTPVSALSFLIFVLLYMPCIAATAAIRREMHSWKWALGAIGFQTGVAWLASFAVYQFGTLFVHMSRL